MYQEIEPAKELSHLIQSFWTFSSSGIPASFKVLPDCCVDLIFDLNQEKAVVSGVMSKYQMRALETESNLISVRFKTELFSRLSTVPLAETKNLRVESQQVIANLDPNIVCQLNERSQTSDQVAFIEICIQQLLNQTGHELDELALNVAKKIRTLKGAINAQKLAASYHISLRQLERRFKKSTGLTMKEFANLIRFSNAKAAIKRCKKKSLLAIAFEAGFYDHAHMNYEFQRIAGENPSTFR
ncbi:MAG: helix-turn-helix domain-containing protein [Bacteroidota bacterium]